MLFLGLLKKLLRVYILSLFKRKKKELCYRRVLGNLLGRKRSMEDVFIRKCPLDKCELTDIVYCYGVFEE